MRRDRLFALLLSAALVGGVGVLAAVDRGGDDHDTLPKLPALSAGGGAESAASGSSAADTSAMRVAAPVEYRVADGVDDLGGEAAAFRLEPDEAIDADVEALARRLGVDGRARRPDPLVVVVEEGGRQVSVFETGGLPWSAGPGPDAPVASIGVCAAPEAGDLPASSVPAEEPACEAASEPPRPSEQDARRVALAFWADLGFEPGELDIQPSYGTTGVSAAPLVGGVEAAGMLWSVAVGADGRVEHANGWSGRPTEIGTYPLVGLRDAVARLAGDDGLYRTMTVEAVPPHPAADGGDACVDCEPAPPPDQPPQVVTVTGARLVLQLLGDHLVPSYELTTDAGYELYAVAVAEEHLADPEPAPVPESRPGGGARTSGDSQEVSR